VQDLRSFLQLLEDEGELARIASPVALNQEVGAVCLRNLRTSGPGLLFERAGDHDIPWPSIYWHRAGVTLWLSA
jgi:4-hydroxy-3-polyprenylbenzoate decarboxylase